MARTAIPWFLCAFSHLRARSRSLWRCPQQYRPGQIYFRSRHCQPAGPISCRGALLPRALPEPVRSRNSEAGTRPITRLPHPHRGRKRRFSGARRHDQFCPGRGPGAFRNQPRGRRTPPPQAQFQTSGRGPRRQRWGRSHLMRSFRDISLGSKLTFLILATSSTALLLACLAVGAYDLLDLKRSMASDLHVIAAIVGENSTAALTFNDANAAHDVLAALRSEPHIQSACIFTRDGRQFARYTRLAGDPGACQPLRPEGSYFTSNRLLQFHTISLAGEPLGVVFIESDLQELAGRRNRYLAIVAAIIAASLGLSSFLASRLQRLVSQPIIELVGTATIISRDKDYSLRAFSRTRAEVGKLIAPSNQLREEITA